MMKVTWLFSILSLCCLHIVVAAANFVSWELENYNNWNLPFAKTVEIRGRDSLLTKFPYYLASNSYKLEVDPSAIFTILFLDPSLVKYDPNDLVTLDYNVFGSTSLLSDVKGIWMDVQIAIPHSLRDIHKKNEWFITDLTIFVAFSTPADNGLDGTLSVCVLPEVGDWKDVSLLQKIEEHYQFTTIYLNYQFTEKSDLFVGYITFEDSTPEMLNAMTFGGQIILQDQLPASDKLFTSDTVPAFLQIKMQQLSFTDILLQNNQIFVTDFANSIYLTPSIAPTHLPTEIYDYMETNFFSWLCVDGKKFNSTFLIDTDQAVPLIGCECLGNQYYGMPEIDFILSVDQYKTGYSYNLGPAEYEMTPRIVDSTRGQMCSLGLWNVVVQKNQTENTDQKQFAVGQNFIRKYNMTLKYTNRNDSGESVSLSVFIGTTASQPSNLQLEYFAAITGCLLLAYLGYFTVLKFRRNKREKVEYSKIIKGIKAVEPDEAKRITKALKAEADFIEGKNSGESLNQRMAARQARFQAKEYDMRNDFLPQRSTEEFAIERKRAYSQVVMRTSQQVSTSLN